MGRKQSVAAAAESKGQRRGGKRPDRIRSGAKAGALAVEILVREQRLRLRRDGNVLMCCAISTSKWGPGTEPGSNRTPTGRFRVAEKHGAGAPIGTIFKSRQPVGRWRPGGRVLPDDLITSRLLWLEGLEPHNNNTYARYIYLHGTNQEHLLGTPHSHGCVRLSNPAVIELYDLVPVGTEVVIR
jgi:lipoprotein-anchoring transpeptidase ErfK/SrfK